jgi:hypothetical protein
MIISKKYKNNLKRLAGLVQENIEFKANIGRSEPNTLSWYAEEYILNLAKQIVNSLDIEISKTDGSVLQISESATKIASNTFSTKLNVKNINNELVEFLLTVSVNFEQNSNTAISVTTKGVTNKFTMNSKHSLSDLDGLKNEAINSFLNSLTLLKKS